MIFGDKLIYKQSPDGSRLAVFSKCETYRYALYIRLDGSRVADGVEGSKSICYLMLNPSTADEMKNDPTIERCCRRAKLLGFNEVSIVNMFAYRSTDPKALNSVSAIGDRNLGILFYTLGSSDEVVLGWGKSYPDTYEKYVRDVRWMLSKCCGHAKCLGKNKDGSPKHPLYVSYNKELEDFF